MSPPTHPGPAWLPKTESSVGSLLAVGVVVGAQSCCVDPPWIAAV